MLKFAGCILVIATTTILGIQKGTELKESYRQLQYIQRLMYLLQSEIRYGRAYLGEIFVHMGKQSIEPYQTWLISLGKKMEQRDGTNFAAMWKDGIETHLKNLSLPSGETERLLILGAQLGNTDIEMQIKILELYQEQLSQTMEEMREGMRVKVRLCHCLGIMGGIFIAVLLL